MQIKMQFDLCSGVGAGFCIAGIRGGLQLIGVAENDKYCSDILSKRFPATPNYGDVKLFVHDRNHKYQNGAIDLITASPPCQPFSIEGNRRGAADERDCFPAIFQIVRQCQPYFAVFENVPGLLSCRYRPGEQRLYFDFILQELSSSGYDAEWFSISSGHFTSPFVRERLLLVAISSSLKLDWNRATPWHEQAGKLAQEARIAERQRGTQPGYPVRVVQNPAELVRPLGIKSGNGTIRQQRKAIGNLLDPRVATVGINRVKYLASLVK